MRNIRLFMGLIFLVIAVISALMLFATLPVGKRTLIQIGAGVSLAGIGGYFVGDSLNVRSRGTVKTPPQPVRSGRRRNQKNGASGSSRSARPSVVVPQMAEADVELPNWLKRWAIDNGGIAGWVGKKFKRGKSSAKN